MLIRVIRVLMMISRVCGESFLYSRVVNGVVNRLLKISLVIIF